MSVAAASLYFRRPEEGPCSPTATPTPCCPPETGTEPGPSTATSWACLLTGPDDDPILFSAGSGTTLLITEMPDKEPAGYATVSFLVTGIEEVVAELAARGAQFLPPGASSFQGVEGRIEGAIVDYGAAKSVWLRDSEGNLLGLNEIVGGAPGR